ncbi:RNA polymerase II mediator complex subunit [Pestalotiopsis sp. 9143b]|nr:RNA polymerase II mediator complex subunit [Pestalotiopsis sp. 9143b]
MAPMAPASHDELEAQLKESLQSMYNILVQTTAYDTAAASSPASSSSSTRPSRDVLAAEIRSLQQSLQQIHKTATTPSPEQSLPHVPPELIQYVENGRNPDIYTREFVELVRRGNQLMKGKQLAFRGFRDVLAEEMGKAMPEIREDARRVVEATDFPPSS